MRLLATLVLILAPSPAHALRNAAPLVVDLIGSGYTDKRRPAPLQPKHIEDYWRREQLGLHKLTPG